MTIVSNPDQLMLTSVKKQQIVTEIRNMYVNKRLPEEAIHYKFFVSRKPKCGDFVCPIDEYNMNRWYFKSATLRVAVNKENIKYIIVRLNQDELKDTKMNDKDIYEMRQGSDSITITEKDEKHRVITLKLGAKTIQYNIVQGRVYLPYIKVKSREDVTNGKSKGEPEKLYLGFYSNILTVLQSSDRIIFSHAKKVYKIPAEEFKKHSFALTSNDEQLDKIVYVGEDLLNQYEKIPF